MMRNWLDAAIGVVRRDAVIFLTYRTQVMTQVLGMLFQLTIFYFISQLLHSNRFGSPEAYFAFVVVGLAIVQALIITLGLTPAQVRQELVAGTMERFIVSAFGTTNGIVSMMVFPIISALVTGATMLALAALVFGLPLAIDGASGSAGGGTGVDRVHAVRARAGCCRVDGQAGHGRDPVCGVGNCDRGRSHVSDCAAAGVDSLGQRRPAVHPRGGSLAPPARELAASAPRRD